ncbi:hypothetical protein [Limnohabitans sp.]|uniref:hypothetical protein n=1 Tax=Limnohabitans sp. TaxID=1907725 RepID=UPI00286F99D6|nr:hypothetical protein [Limnohabitans sp.]
MDETLVIVAGLGALLFLSNADASQANPYASRKLFGASTLGAGIKPPNLVAAGYQSYPSLYGGAANNPYGLPTLPNGQRAYSMPGSTPGAYGLIGLVGGLAPVAAKAYGASQAWGAADAAVGASSTAASDAAAQASVERAIAADAQASAAGSVTADAVVESVATDAAASVGADAVVESIATDASTAEAASVAADAAVESVAADAAIGAVAEESFIDSAIGFIADWGWL